MDKRIEFDKRISGVGNDTSLPTVTLPKTEVLWKIMLRFRWKLCQEHKQFVLSLCFWNDKFLLGLICRKFDLRVSRVFQISFHHCDFARAKSQLCFFSVLTPRRHIIYLLRFKRWINQVTKCDSLNIKIPISRRLQSFDLQ